MSRLSQFPTPYPDECYYSILCRYQQRMGYTSFDRTMKSLFGSVHHTDMFVLLPYLASGVNSWIDPESGISAESITRNHTAYVYYQLSNQFNYDTTLTIKEQLWQGKRKYHTGFRGSKKEQLYHCPLCTEEERRIYGEAYWHRLHQIKGVDMCIRHGVALKSSNISFLQTKKAFIPASSIRYGHKKNDVMDENAFESGKKYVSDVEWILESELAYSKSDVYIHQLLKQYFVKNGYTITPKNELIKSELEGFEDFWRGIRNGYTPSSLYEASRSVDDYFPLWRFLLLRPHDIILLMEFLEGSAEGFYNHLI